MICSACRSVRAAPNAGSLCTPHCSACRAWKALLPRALGETEATLFEVDVAQATGIARYYDIFHLPTIYFYRDGRFHAELQAEARIESIRAATQALLAAPAQEEP
jgi:thioredoxin-like negative regulator of GroEL